MNSEELLIRKLKAQEIEYELLEKKHKEALELLTKYGDALEKFKSCFNYEQPSLNAYVQWFQEKQKLGIKDRIAFPDYVEEVVFSILPQ